MKTINTHGITYIEPVSGGTPEWYYGISYEHGDLYEAEEVFRSGEPVRGNSLCLIHYPGGEIFWPIPKETGMYTEKPVYLEEKIYLLNVDFPHGWIRIFCFGCKSHEVALFQELPLSSVKNCYNLQLHSSPLSLTRQGEEDMFEIIWPERISFPMDPHESFFLRDGERLYFSKWYEEGEGPEYRYWEETVIRDLGGNLLETMPGNLQVMPNGEVWYLTGLD
ncbi:MAG: hypothetical protein IJ091_09175 [Oscillospiraceae bacterium]|nr:hypothetical protein [Oscillospiraceae bacterium]